MPHLARVKKFQHPNDIEVSCGFYDERYSGDHFDLKAYGAGTFDRRVAYGQRQRKLMLVSKGIIDGFKVSCESDKKAANLAYAFRLRSRRIEKDEKARYSLRIKIDRKTVYVTRKGPLRLPEREGERG